MDLVAIYCIGMLAGIAIALILVGLNLSERLNQLSKKTMEINILLDEARVIRARAQAHAEERAELLLEAAVKRSRKIQGDI
jgi:hypothetical protein